MFSFSQDGALRKSPLPVTRLSHLQVVFPRPFLTPSNDCSSLICSWADVQHLQLRSARLYMISASRNYDSWTSQVCSNQCDFPDWDITLQKKTIRLSSFLRSLLPRCRLPVLTPSFVGVWGPRASVLPTSGHVACLWFGVTIRFVMTKKTFSP